MGYVTRLTPGAALARGAARFLTDLNISTLFEFCPVSGKRVDVIGLTPSGEIWIVECKSSREDFRSDHKWQDYLPYCDRFFWAVGPDFPIDILPEETGLLIADAFGAEMLNEAPLVRLSANRRKTMTLKFAHHAAQRLHKLLDPAGMQG